MLRKTFSVLVLMMLLISLLSSAVTIQPVAAPPYPTIHSCDISEVEKNTFGPLEIVYAFGDNYDPYESVTIYVTPNGGPYTSPNSVSSKAAQADSSGHLGPVAVGTFPTGEYDIWVDRGLQNGWIAYPDEPADTFGSVPGFSFKAGGTIYIRADGSIDPPTAPIERDGNIYAFTDNIFGSIMVEKDNIVLDGADYTLQGVETGAIGINLTYRYNVTIKNMEIQKFYYGIYIRESSSNSIVGNNITANDQVCIYLDRSSNYNSIIENNVTNKHSGYGLLLDSSSNNSIVGNQITSMWGNALREFSNNNSLISNAFTDDGLSVCNSYQNVVENNTVNSKPLVYLEDVSNYLVDNAGQLILVKCSNIRVEHLDLSNTTIGVQLHVTNNTIIAGNNVSNNRQGIQLDSSSNNSIVGNQIAGNIEGISLSESPDNSIVENNITANGWGICLLHPFSSDNLIYHNNFMDNSYQVMAWSHDYSPPNVWDDGYPSGGNYWSDYTEWYPFAEELDGSGLWDTPYVIDENNQDNYPLINPWTPGPPEAPDNFADLGNVTDEATHSLNGWGAAQGPPENPYVSPSGDDTKRYMLLRGDNSADLLVDEANVPYYLTAEVEDGICTDNFEIYVNGEGPIYTYIGKNAGPSTITAVRHEVLVPAEYITGQKVTITFRNTATDDCGLAAVYNVRLTLTLPKFRIGDWVQTTATLNAREGPGLSYPIISTMPEGTLGQIMSGPVEADGYVWWDVNYAVDVRGWSVENWLASPPTCAVKLQRDDVEINKVAIGEFFDIYVGDSTDDIGIKKVRFLSDESQNGEVDEGFTWTPWYNWSVSPPSNWDAETKNMRWVFATYGVKEVWAEMNDTDGMVSSCSANIFAVLPLPEWKEIYRPNPSGYSFKNNIAVDKNIPILPGDESLTEQSRWDIFVSTFDLSNVDEKTLKEYFKKLNEEELFTGAYCYGMAASSLMEFVYPMYDQFLENQGVSTMFELEEPPMVLFDPWERWHGGGEEGPHPLLEHIIRYHLFQYGKPAVDNYEKLEPQALLDRLEEDLSNDRMCVLGIGYDVQSKDDVNKDGKIDDRDIESKGHAVVPYSVDGKDIYVYDPNWPNNDEKKIEIYEEEGVWKWRFRFDPPFKVWPAADAIRTRLILFPIEALYNSGMKPRPSEGILFLSGQAILLLTDSMGRSTGFKDGTFVEEIPGVKPIYDFNALPDEEAHVWRQTYYIDGENEVTIMITGTVENGTYSLTRFGDGYFASISDISIGEGAVDSITFTSNHVTIHISQNQEPKTYNLTLNKNMEGASQAFTAVSIPAEPGATYQYTIDWAVLSAGGEGAMAQIDADGDGVFEHIFTSDSELTQNEYVIATDKIPPETWVNIGEPKFVAEDITYLISDTGIVLMAEDDPGGSGVGATAFRIHNDAYDSGWVTYAEPFHLIGLSDGTYLMDYNSTDNAGNVEPTNTQLIILDNTPPVITETNFEGLALQDGVKFEVSAWDLSEVASMTFSIQCTQGDIVASMPAALSPEGKWGADYDTTLLPDGFYSAIITGTDVLGNTGDATVSFSIRNWACVELLPATQANKAGRTMPVKFSVRVAEGVDPTQPFVYNEELTVKIYATDDPANILQTSTFGITARDYRIDTIGELYITNFKTSKRPTTYRVEIWRKDMLLDWFEFSTVK